MMRSFREWLLMATAGVAVASCATSAPVTTAEKQFRATFVNMPVERVATSEIPGIFEVYSQGRLFYFAPEQNLILFGELYTTGGESLTQQKIAQYLKGRTLEIPPDVGVTVGEGPTELIAFLDPDCGHCMEAHAWLEARDYAGLRLRVLFPAMPPENPSYARVIQFVCAPAELRREALRQIYAHESPAPGQRLLSCDGAATQLQAQAQIARNLGIDGTPTFSLNGQVVPGFDRGRLEALLQQP